MPYLRSPRRAGRALGFTAEEERALLDREAAESESLQRIETQLTELTDNAKRQEALRTFQVVAIVGGFLYTLAQIGELVAGARRRRLEKTATDKLIDAAGAMGGGA